MEQSINYLLEGKVDGYIDAQIGVLNYLNKNIIAGVKGISQNQFDPSPLYFFINSDKPILQIILNKALEDITPQEIKSIISKWIHATNQRSNKIDHLTKAQKEYLQKNKKFTMCNNPNWAPLEFKENGKMQGIAIDYLQKIEEILDIEFETVDTQTWTQSQKFLQEKKCDILLAASKTASREKYALFTQNYMSHKLAIITRNDAPFVDSIDAILEKPMTRKKGSGLISVLKKNHPTINIVETTGYEQSMKMVSSGEAYYTVATLPVASYYIGKFGLYNLQIAGYLDMQFDLAIAVRDDKPLLRDILDKTISTIPPRTITEIQNSWQQVKIQEANGIKIEDIIKISIVVFLVIFLSLYRQYKLKEHRNELRETNQKFQMMINNTMEAILLLKDGIIIEVNTATLKIFENKKEQIVGRSIFDFIAQDSHKIVKENMKKDSVPPYEINLQLFEDRPTPVLVQASNFITNEQKIRFVSILDLTKIKHKEQLLAQNGKMAAMGEMIANIAHQWRQPLSVISTSATGIKVQKEYGVLDDKFLFHACDLIDSNAQYLSNTIDDFRNFIKGDRVKKKFQTKELIESFLNLVQPSCKTHNIEVIVDVDESLTTDSYKNELLQCFVNIFNNSKDAFVENSVEKRVFFLSIVEENHHIIISFQDNAGGIPQEILPKIFDPYFTTKHQSYGTGIGLNMTYNLITQGMKGTITASNKTFEYQDDHFTGAFFLIEFPA